MNWKTVLTILMFILAIAVYVIHSHFASSNAAIKWTPTMSPISFVLDKNGVSISAGEEFVTPIGVIDVSADLSPNFTTPENKDSYIVVIRYRDKDNRLARPYLFVNELLPLGLLSLWVMIS
jgi:hypothetical protein